MQLRAEGTTRRRGSGRLGWQGVIQRQVEACQIRHSENGSSLML